MPHVGHCLCGQTGIKVASTHDSQIACHCTDCQRTSGSHASMNILPLIKDVKLTGNVKQFDAKAASGNTEKLTDELWGTVVTRLFCGNCGSALAHKTPAFGDAMAVQTGNLLDDFTKVPIGLELFIKSRWTGIPAIPKAEQAWTMPGTSAPKL
ncbi:hypothetical protein MNV49_004927 [Pseudohyphozyma bogoriensis]|nr:hypothetical protein MNV49_004927 [Pseudohyphozyma bogoriensis]